MRPKPGKVICFGLLLVLIISSLSFALSATSADDTPYSPSNRWQTSDATPIPAPTEIPTLTVTPAPHTPIPEPTVTPPPPAPPIPPSWQEMPQDLQDYYDVIFYFPGQWITMTSQPLPTIILCLDPTFFPNCELRVFDVPNGTTNAQFHDIIKQMYPSENGGEYDNFQVLEEGNITLDSGYQTVYMVYKGTRMGYGGQAFAIFMVRGTQGFVLAGVDYPMTFEDSKLLLVQIVKTFHFIYPQPLLPYRTLPETVGPGQTFDVIITFISPSDEFEQIVLIDEAPAGWTVSVDTCFCSPFAMYANTPSPNKAEYTWFYDHRFDDWFNIHSTDTQFTVVYKFTIPLDAPPGNYTFTGKVGYKIDGEATIIYENIRGQSSVILTEDRMVMVSIDAPATVSKRQDFVATVNVNQHMPDLAAYQFGLVYDPNVIQIIGAENGTEGVTPGLIGLATIPLDAWSFKPVGTPGLILVIGHLPAPAFATGTGYLAQIHFYVIGSVGQTSQLTPVTDSYSFSNGLYNSYGREIILGDWIGTTVSVVAEALIPGDANGDGIVDMGDVTKIERIILGMDSPASAIDTNGDGLINMGDVTKIERIILGLGIEIQTSTDTNSTIE